MIEFVAWFGVGVIALFSIVGFTGVVVTSVMTLVRRVRHMETPQQVRDFERERVSSAA